MNERIKELVKLTATDTSGKWVSIENVENLAELIVRECADVCSNVLDYHAILEKFGVE